MTRKRKPTPPPEPRRPGRPTALTGEVAEQIEAYIREGAYPETAARAAGVSERSYYRWLERGEAESERREAYDSEHPLYAEMDLAGQAEVDPDEAETRTREDVYLAFWQSTQKAVALAEIETVSSVRSGGQDWQSRAWVAERRWRDRWGRTQRTEISGPGGGAVQVETTSTSELLALADELTGGYDEADEAEGPDRDGAATG